MFTRSKGKVENLPDSSKPRTSRSPSQRTARSGASSETLKAQKAAAEALVLRRRLEREQELAAIERERERRLADLQSQVEDSELQAELAALNVEARSSHGGSRASSRSQGRTRAWVEDCRVSIAAQPAGTVPRLSPGYQVPPAVRAAAPDPAVHTQTRTKPLEAVGPIHIDDNYLILKAVADTAAAAKVLASTASGSKKLELSPFAGNPVEWLQFKRIYNFSKHSFSPLENIVRLQKALRGPAREAVAALLMSTENPDEVICALEENFARPELIVFKEVNSLKNLPRLGHDLKELGALTNRVRNSVSTIKLLQQTEYLHSPELFHAVLCKLNPTMKIRWTDFAVQDATNRSKLEKLSVFLQRELDQHVRFGLSPEHNTLQHNSFAIENKHKRESVNATRVKANTESRSTTKSECAYCEEAHNIKACSRFKSLSVDNRREWLFRARVCYKCLGNKPHTWRDCKVDPCGVNGCTSRFHHPLVHPLLHENTPQQFPVNSTNADPIYSSPSRNIPTTSTSSEAPIEKVLVASTSSSSVCRPRALLKIIPVTVSGPAGSRNVFALLDDGSTATLIDAHIAAQIGATGPQQSITVHGIGGLSRTAAISYVNFNIKGRYASESFEIKNARSMEGLALSPQSVSRATVSALQHLKDLEDLVSYEHAKPTVLIGAEHWFLTLSREVRVGKRNEPVAVRTALGWALYGLACSKTKPIDFVQHTRISSDSDCTLESLIREQYKIDSLGILKSELRHNRDDSRAVQILKETAKRLPTGRFEVGMPWRENIQAVPDSYPQAMSRFLSLRRRMFKETEFADAYHVFMNNMLDKGYAEECAPETYYGKNNSKVTSENFRLYLPHFGVYHPQKRKLRVVHDAAATNEGVSLNSLLLPGPDLLQSLLTILFRFREGRVALTADIKEMFPQVRIREQDRDALRYLWQPKTQPLKEYRMTAVIFGACCSPFIAQFIKNKNALEHKHLYPEAADAILNSHYMDDYIGSHDSADKAAKLASDVVTVHKAAGFEMRGWISNDPRALSLIPSDLRAAESLEIELGNTINNVRALGIAWNPASDSLGFRTGIAGDTPDPLTKRQVLSHLMRVYDPLGLLGPIVVKGRILFQKAWRLSSDWDSVLPPMEAAKWLDWFQELGRVTNLQIPRWYSKLKESEPAEKELHVFADASELAYACVAYWRLLYPDGSTELSLISSKARVSPLKPISIPRLELQAALIASRLATVIMDSHQKKPTRVFFWTDSMTVLQWLRSDARSFKPFVAHRLGEIMEATSVSDWRWVPTDLNVADDATRLRPINLSQSHRWFRGPPFLLKAPEDWPSEPAISPQLSAAKCEKRSEVVGLTTTVSLVTPITPQFERFSDWLRLLRATARVLQAVAIFGNVLVKVRNSKTLDRRALNCRRRQTTSTTLPPLSAELIKAAERQILRRSQVESFPKEIQCLLNGQTIPQNSRLIRLSPTLGEDNLLRLVGRIKSVEDIDPETRSPVLLDGRHPAIRLLVRFYHRRAGHANKELVVNEIRQRFWLIRLRDAVRSVVNQCLLCKIRKSLPNKPVTGDLPMERLAHHQRPFKYAGIDYFGPITVTVGRRHEKRYVALITCLTTRALHLELVHSLSADSAIMALRRFIARRGAPSKMFSDNGTAFVGANRILKEFNSSNVVDYAATKQIQWSFIPPAAPNFGGCWERLVRSVKVALGATLKERAPKEEVLCTLLAEAEAIVNSRPLSHVSLEPEDPTALTPFHFLIGQSSDQSLPNSLDDGDLSGRCDWKKALRLADHFWNRWVREVLPLLQPRDQARHGSTEPKIGDIVIIADESLPRGVWPKGRVTKLHPGKDGVVRVVDVATQGGVLRRPTRKLVVLAT